MSDLHDELRAKQREMDDLRRRARDDPDATLRSHSVAHGFSEGEESDSEAAELRQRVADMFDLDPAQFEGVDAGTLETIYNAETADSGDREHVADRSPSADMRGRGGSGDGAPADSGEDSPESSYPRKGRENWQRRQHAGEESGRASNGYPKPGRSNWKAREGRTATERPEDRRREHSSASGKVERRRQRATETGDGDDEMSRRERERRRRARYSERDQ